MSAGIQTISKGEETMAYETKALLIAIANIMRLSKDMKQAYEALVEMANSEGVIVKPLEDENEEEA
jgi:hypothetical protein